MANIRQYITMDMDTAFNNLMDEKIDLQPSTRQNYVKFYSWMMDWWRSKGYPEHVLDIEPEYVEGYARYLRNERKCSATTIRIRFDCLKVYFSYIDEYVQRRVKRLMYDGKIDRAPWWEHPCSTLKLEKEKKQIHHLSRDQIQDILNILDTTKYNGFRDYVMIRFLVDTGLRINECVNVTWSMVNLQNRSVSVPGTISVIENGRTVQRNYTKTGEPRTIAISEETKEGLMKLREWTKSVMKEYDEKEGYIFVGIFSKRVEGQPQPVSKTEFGRRLKQYGQIAGIQQRCTPHVLRHTTATLLAEAGADAFYIQKYMGHASIKTTQRYVTMSEKHVVEKYDQYSILD